MSEVHAYDMSRFQRIINVDGGRVTGSFRVMPDNRRNVIWVDPIEVTVWDEYRISGRVIYSTDMRTIKVRDGHADITGSISGGPKASDIEDAIDEFASAVLAAANAFPVGVGETGGGE